MKFSDLKKFFNKINKTQWIGILTILIFVWSILYFIPETFLLLFSTFLGNLILIITTIVVYSNDKIYGILLGSLLLVLFRFYMFSKEGFTQQSELDFLKLQHTINRNKVFDMDVLNKQATQEELDYFNKNGYWPWSQRTIQLYQEALSKNPYVKSTPENATNYARTIYNESSILMILSYQTKEGEFLLNGVLVKDPSGNKLEDMPSGFGSFPYHAGLIGNRTDDIIRCNMQNSNNPTLERIRFTGKGGIFQEQNSKVTPIDYRNLEKEIPGFTFLNQPCNPCGAIATTPDYSCPFRLRVKNKSPFISNVWQYLWGVNDNPLESQPSFLSETINPNEFPLLSELQTELQKQDKYSKNI